MPSLRLSKEWLLEVMQSEPVRAGLRNMADKIASEVDAEAAMDEHYDPSAHGGNPPTLDVTVSEGVRPKGRPYARVSIPKEDEYGDYALPKRRILGRLAARHNTPKGG